MEIRDGWTAPYGRRKFDVTFDEGDFRCLLSDLRLSPETHVPGGVKFRIMRQQAAVLSLGEMAAYLKAAGDPEDQLPLILEEHAAALTERNDILRQLVEGAR